jgi:hypothetical protein
MEKLRMNSGFGGSPRLFKTSDLEGLSADEIAQKVSYKLIYTLRLSLT